MKKSTNKKVRVLIVEDDIQTLNSIIEFLSNDERFEICGQAQNGTEAIALIDTINFDVCLVDIVLPEIDGYGVLEYAKKVKPEAKVIMLSELGGDSLINKAEAKGADYYMLKPVDLTTLATRMLEVHSPKSITAYERTSVLPDRNTFPREKTLEEKITNIFITVGIPAHIKGYNFLREAIKMAVKTPDVINAITRRLYPTIAEKYDTSASKVERAIRHAIEVAWNRGKIENINHIFGVKIYNHNEKPTNGEFIALVADRMNLDGAS
ncbi:MAG: sporulation transcription factor Spo0A [Firmicutes bacterium]|nr:sporulation transcription factor Spo0A [Bacillota bacterium]